MRGIGVMHSFRNEVGTDMPWVLSLCANGKVVRGESLVCGSFTMGLVGSCFVASSMWC